MSAPPRWQAGGVGTGTAIAKAVAGAECVVTMLPEGRHVRAVYMDQGGVFAPRRRSALLIDCSTIDVETAAPWRPRRPRAISPWSTRRCPAGSPVREAATLTFMVGGPDSAFARSAGAARMGKAVIHAGGAGNGQAAKICNNMMLGIQMISVCEAMALARRLAAAGAAVRDQPRVVGQCWSLTSYCPVPGPVPSSPANRDYQPGFTTAMMLKDLKLAQAAASLGASTPWVRKPTSSTACSRGAGMKGWIFPP